ncbi:MAG: succinyl-diaminopimelate desuccinylase, partial [Methylobacterium sp.]|nr:succinyl-diaminopimelate desuccinylase [Methylobacterium sp.]
MSADLSRAAALTRDLVRCASVTPEEGGALALIEAVLKPYGFDVHRPVFSEAGSPEVENLHARLGTE